MIDSYFYDLRTLQTQFVQIVARRKQSSQTQLSIRMKHTSADQI